MARGLAVAGMVLVNNPGDAASAPAQLRHAAWHGLTVADLVFPAFVFFVGASLAFGTPTMRRILWRGVALFVLGLIVNAVLARSMDVSQLRLTGVLQRLALAYVVTALVARWRRPWLWALLAVALFIGHWQLLDTQPLEPAHNLSRTIDRNVLDPAHLYRGGPTDPEGVLGTLSTIGTAVLGLLAATWVRGRPRSVATSAVLFAAGSLGVISGSWWHHLLPLNKRLWTPSYALLTAGVALLVLAVCHFSTDVVKRGGPLVVAEALGRNALVVYVGSEVLAAPAHSLVWSPADGLVGSSEFASVVHAVMVTTLWAAVAFLLHRRRWYVTI